MQTSRPQPAMLEGLSRFLIMHERCGAGFDVAHPAGVGSGRVSITCRGCGARHEYLTSTIEIEREVQFQVQPASDPLVGAAAAAPPIAAASASPPKAPAEEAATSRQPAFAPTAPGGPPPPSPKDTAEEPEKPPSAPPPSQPAAERGRGITGARAGTVALLAVAVIAVVVALLRLSGGSNNDNAQTSAAPNGGNPVPTTPQPEQPAQPPQQQPQQPSQPQVLRPVTTPTYKLAIPADWTVNSNGPALRIAPPNSDAVILRVYSDKRPDLSLADMGRLSAELLQRDHPGSSPSSVHATKVGGIDAATVGVDFDGGSETAFAIARGEDRYLLLVEVGKNASAAERRQMAEVVASFRPA